MNAVNEIESPTSGDMIKNTYQRHALLSELHSQRWDCICFRRNEIAVLSYSVLYRTDSTTGGLQYRQDSTIEIMLQ